MERAPGLIDRNQFYNYGIRFLLERVGWYVRDHGGSGSICHPIFHQISDFPYQALKDYLDLVQWMSPEMVKEIWGIPQFKEANYKMIEFADFFCGAVACAFNANTFGLYDPAYLLQLEHLLYRCGAGANRTSSYGLKSFPWDDKIKSRYDWIDQIL